MPHVTEAASQPEGAERRVVRPEAEQLDAHALAAVVGERNVLVDEDVRAPFEEDWTRRFRGSADAVVRPGSADEVAAVLRACGEAGAAVIPQGGNTGMVGASVPRPRGDRPQVVLSLT